MATRSGPALLLLALLASPLAAASTSALETTRVASSAHGLGLDSAFPHLDGRGVVVAVLSTGVDNEHAGFAGAYLTGVDVSSPCPPAPGKTPSAADVSCYQPSDPDATLSGGSAAGFVALGRPVDGFRGVAPAARLVDVKLARDGVTAAGAEGLLRALLWVEAHNALHPKGDALHVDVVLSGSRGMGDAQPDDPVTKATERLAAQGVVVVVAPTACTSRIPVSCPEDASGPAPVRERILVVAGMEDRGTADRGDDSTAAWDAEHEPGFPLPPLLHAPSSNLTFARFSPFPGQAEQGWINGSTPDLAIAMVAGVAALLLQDQPHLTPGQVRQAIASGAYEVPGTTRLALDAHAAVLAARALGDPPVPAFSWTPALLREGQEAGFDAGASVRAAGYAWDFGDGATATGATARHAFAAAGAYDVRLRVRDAQERTADLTRRVEVLPALRDARLALSPADPAPLAWVDADFSASLVSRGLAAHAIDWGDGARLSCTAAGCQGADANTTGGWNGTARHRYASPGEYVVRVDLTDAGGATFGDETRLRVAYPAPQARLEARPSSAAVGMPVAFDASTSAVPAGLAEARWDFGDGTARTCPSEACPDARRVEHRYVRAGSYDARVTLRDAEGRDAVATLRVVVRDPASSLAPPPGSPPAATPTAPPTTTPPPSPEPAALTPRAAPPTATAAPAPPTEETEPTTVVATPTARAAEPEDPERPAPGPALPAALALLGALALLRRRR